MSKKVVVLGAGESGTGAALLAKSQGYDVFVSDYGEIADEYKNELSVAGIAFETGMHTEENILDADEVIKSPGISPKVAIVQKLIDNNIPVLSEIEFAYRFSKAKFVAITGSNGKTTTTLLTHHLLKSAGYKVGLAGNVGHSLARQVINEKVDYYVVELSSFQLDNMYEFRADVAVLLNITPDHLDRYDNDFSKYVQSKLRITQNMTNDNYFVSYMDDPTLSKELQTHQTDAFKLVCSLDNRILNGAYISGDYLMVNINNHITRVFKIPLSYITLSGSHNLINTMCAVLAATASGVSDDVIEKALGSFKNAPHRLEYVGMHHRVRFINDSKATNVDSVKYALDAYERPIIWIAGGVDKGNDYSVLKEQVYEKVTAIICLGKNTQPLKDAFEDIVPIMLDADSMEDAVAMANEVANREGVVLLSPACASFDLFKNYEDRGDQFKYHVKKIMSSSTKLNFITL